MSSSCCSMSQVTAPVAADVLDSTSKSTPSGADVQDISVTVRGGYSPSTIALKAGVPTRLIFNRDESSGCSSELLIPAFGVQKPLAAFATTVVEFTPTRTGTFGFSCGMQMLRGTLVVS